MSPKLAVWSSSKEKKGKAERVKRQGQMIDFIRLCNLTFTQKPIWGAAGKQESIKNRFLNTMQEPLREK